MNTIYYRYNELLEQIKKTYFVEEFSVSGLEIRLLGINELLESGFIDKNLRKVLDINDGELKNSIEEYFERECCNVMAENVDCLVYPEGPVTVGEYIFFTKYGIVRCCLKRKLINFLEKLKEINPYLGTV
jgi:hypothetical protein